MSYGGGVLHFVRRGEGAPVRLLVHGFLGSGRNLGGLARAWGELAPNQTFVLPDLLGHGRSPALPENASLTDMAHALVELIAHLDLDGPADIIGHSLGGRVALETRRLAPDRVKAVVLLDIKPGPIAHTDTESVVQHLLNAPAQAPTREAMRAELQASGISLAIAEWLLMSGANGPGGFAWRIDRNALADFHRGMRAADLWPAVAAGPTACVYGGESSYIGPEDVGRFEKLGMPVERIDGAGHFLHVDKTQEVVQALHRVVDSGIPS